GAGTAMFGLRHHDLFDVIAPLGGPVDWTWLLHYIENNHLGGFRSIPPGTTLGDLTLEATSCASAADCKPDETCVGALGLPPGKCVLMPTPKDPYEHAQTFNTWWYEYPREGNGGSFPRSEYAQIFRDLALMFGNPNGENLTPGGENLPAGVHPDDPSQVGDHANGECKVWVDPLDGPDKEKQEAIADSCPAERCSHTLSLANYYDDEYNPDGTFPVITICDGSPQNQALTPYANSWAPGNNNYPLEVGLAVDYNANGVRDELEPVIRAGHERWFDHGVDGVPSSAEPGYMKGVNDDPAGDDYNAQYNPAGTEGDMRRQPEEMFEDTGLDGVMGTKQQPAGGYTKPGDGYDVGEGDGKFTVASGLQRFWDYDPHSIVRKMTSTVPGGELTDEALSRIDLWTDGGTRDLFNFHVDAQHLAGTFAARGRDVAYFTGFTELPGLDPETPNDFSPPKVIYEDLQGIVFQRYGKIDPAPVDIQNGSGQHVGKASEVVTRLQSALYFIGSGELLDDVHVELRAHGAGGHFAAARVREREAAGPALPGHLHAARLRADARGPERGGDPAPELDEQLARERGEPPAEGDPRVRGRALPRRRERQARVHPRDVLHGQRARGRRAERAVVARADGLHRPKLPDDGRIGRRLDGLSALLKAWLPRFRLGGRGSLLRAAEHPPPARTPLRHGERQASCISLARARRARGRRAARLRECPIHPSRHRLDARKTGVDPHPELDGIERSVAAHKLDGRRHIEGGIDHPAVLSGRAPLGHLAPEIAPGELDGLGHLAALRVDGHDIKIPRPIAGL
ncbi:MAG: hypothetical protein L6Q76_38350, partial [Polyangiaceae bacterium]|nr:hypothetical protein [Polyangiaceae bacterium]